MKFSIFFFIYLFQTVFSDIVTVKDAEDTGSKRTGYLLEIKDKIDLFISSVTFFYENKPFKIKNLNGGTETICSGITNCNISFTFALEQLPELNRLELVFETTDVEPRSKYWKIDNVILIYTETSGTGKLNLNTDHFTAPQDYSFSCSNLELTPKHGQSKDKDKMHANFNKISISNFQIQPFNSSTLFRESYDCSSWFTIGSFMGLIIILMFTSILAFGICLILNIKTNDRFEDPKGKPLVLGSIDG